MSAEEQNQCIYIILKIIVFQVWALKQKLFLTLKLEFSIFYLCFELWMLIPYFPLPKGKDTTKETPSLYDLFYKEVYVDLSAV